MYLATRRPARRPPRHRVRALARRLRDERGFTLLELLVATVAGIVVTAAMGAIVVVAVHFTSSTTDRVDANQQGRLAMTKITQALNSSCVSAGVPPIQPNSDANDLIFLSALSDAPSIYPNLLTVQLSGGALTMLTDANVGSTGSTGATGATGSTGATGTTAVDGWTVTSTPTISFTLVQHATNAVVSGTTVPVFQYYTYNSTTGTISNNVTPSTGQTLGADAANVVEVVISYQALPTDNWNAGGRPANISDSVVLRLTPASASGATGYAPCS
jgi:Tfp pilus assembly protein PilW